MFILIVLIHIIVSLIIIGLVLLQSGKGADIGSMGTPTVLGKITTVAAVLFLVTSFSLAVLSHRRAETIMPATVPAASSPASPVPPAAVPAAPARPAPEKK